MTIRVGNGAGFLGDNLDAPRRLAETAELDYLTLEYLAELTLSILARQREKDANAGFAQDFLEVLRSLVPSLQARPALRLVTNAGGVHPQACARHAGRILTAAGLADCKLAAVWGDDLLARLSELERAGCEFRNLDTGQPLRALPATAVSANAYLGAEPICQALGAESRVVITGRVADASLTVAPAVHEFGWSWDEWDRLAGASVAGHIIECGAQATGGFYPYWSEFDWYDLGYPIAELNPDGSAVITRPAKSGGVLNRETVCEQLVYEIGDPEHYLTPDVDVDFTTVEVETIGPDRVMVRGATGRARPESLKVSLAYRAGYASASTMLVYGRDCLAKARKCAELVLDRVRTAGYELQHSLVECLGSGAGVPGVMPAEEGAHEVMLRVSVRDLRRDAVERFVREFAPLATSGPAGLAGYAGGRSSVRPVYAYWPTLVPRDLVQPCVEVATASDWARRPDAGSSC